MFPLLPLPPHPPERVSGSTVGQPDLAVVSHITVPQTGAENFHTGTIDLVDAFTQQVQRVVDAMHAAEDQYRVAASSGQHAVEESKRLHEHLPYAISMLARRNRARDDKIQFHDVNQVEKMITPLKIICDLLMSSIHILDKECVEAAHLQRQLSEARDKREKRKREWDCMLHATRSDMATALDTFRGMQETAAARSCKLART